MPPSACSAACDPIAGVAATSAVVSDFDALVAEYGPAIRRVAASYERDIALAEDLTQEMLVAIWRAWPTFRGEASARTFVLRIAHNRGASHAMTQSRQPRSTDELPDMASPEGSALDRAERQEQADRLLAAVRALPLAQRQLVTLALEGLSYAEMATVLDITSNLVGVRLNRARSALSKQLAAEATP